MEKKKRKKEKTKVDKYHTSPKDYHVLTTGDTKKIDRHFHKRRIKKAKEGMSCRKCGVLFGCTGTTMRRLPGINSDGSKVYVCQACLEALKGEKTKAQAEGKI